MTNGEIINKIHYADDTIIITEHMDDLQRLLDRVNRKSEKFLLSINLSRTKVIAISNNLNIKINITINNY